MFGCLALPPGVGQPTLGRGETTGGGQNWQKTLRWKEEKKKKKKGDGGARKKAKPLGPDTHTRGAWGSYQAGHPILR